jgi:hypothetical protein
MPKQNTVAQAEVATVSASAEEDTDRLIREERAALRRARSLEQVDKYTVKVEQLRQQLADAEAALAQAIAQAGD